MKEKITIQRKLLDWVVSGIGSVAGSMLAPWKARREAQAKQIDAEGDAKVLQIQAKAHAEARAELVPPDAEVDVELDITNAVNQRLRFQEKKRQINITSVVTQAAAQLGEGEVENNEPDHDWIARFFNDVQDVSSEEMQSLWARILAGEIERTGSTSIQTLGILKNLDQATSRLFRKFCSACIFLNADDQTISDARVPSLGGNAGDNSLRAYGLDFDALNVLNEHGLIISDYNSWCDYRVSIEFQVGEPPRAVRLPFRFQDRYWVLIPTHKRDSNAEFRLSGVALTRSGRELSNVVGSEAMNEFSQALSNFFQGQNLQMTEVESGKPQIFR